MKTIIYFFLYRKKKTKFTIKKYVLQILNFKKMIRLRERDSIEKFWFSGNIPFILELTNLTVNSN